MNLREYLKYRKTTIVWVSKTANVPYTTVSEIANGKLDIQKVQFGTVLRICKALKITTNKLFELCVVPENSWDVFLDKDVFYMSYYFGNERRTVELCQNTPTNSKYINNIAKCYYEELMCESEYET